MENTHSHAYTSIKSKKTNNDSQLDQLNANKDIANAICDSGFFFKWSLKQTTIKTNKNTSLM